MSLFCRSLTPGAAAVALCAAACGAACGAKEDAVASARISVAVEKRIGTISPEIYGHFTEHLGGVIYDGIWVGPDSDVPNIHGIRKDLVDWMKRIRPAVIRWPGGCFADKYHWTDGIGPREKRPARFGRWNDSTESNAFGTHEFIEFCRLVGARPYLAGNVGTGTVEEFQSWVEYCNAPAGTTAMARLREANGSKEPFGVQFWGVGNEAWGCGGSFTPEDYCREYRKFATWLPGYGQKLFLIACGPSGNDTQWTRRFFEKFEDYKAVSVHGWAPHYYCGTAGTALEYSTDQWYELIERASQMEALIAGQWKALAERDPEHHVKLAVDEWGCWHPPGTEINKAHTFEQMSTLRDAMVAALTLDTFNRHCDKVVMANIAQLINNLHSLFLADGPRFVATPNFYVYEMYSGHQGAAGLPVAIESPKVEFRAGDAARSLPALSGSASLSESVLRITVTNISATKPVEAALDLSGIAVKSAKETVLTSADIHAHNTFNSPKAVVPVTRSLSLPDGALRHTFAPASVTLLEFELK
jgi:alpha-N-arabinofuranosidase